MKHKKTKGQIAGQVFIYIMAAVIIGGIALIGYNAVVSITTKACQAQKAVFDTDIESMIEEHNSYGSINIKNIKAPCNYDQLCFVDSSKINRDPSLSEFKCDNVLISDSVNQNIETNIFVISNQRTSPLGYSEILSLNLTNKDSCLCIPQTNGRFYIKFEGQGHSTQVSQGKP